MAMIDNLARNSSIPSRSRGVFSLGMRLALWRSRRALARLDAAALEDIGIDREAALREARLGVWDAPESWIAH